jgi:hypothetical protein
MAKELRTTMINSLHHVDKIKDVMRRQPIIQQNKKKEKTPRG